MKKGGYVMIDLTSTSLVDDLGKALTLNKPVLVYDANNNANYFTLSYDSVNDVYTLNGAKDSFTIDSTGQITPVSNESRLYRHNVTMTSTQTIGEASGNLTVGLFIFSYDENAYENIASLPNQTSNPTICSRVALKGSVGFLANYEIVLATTTYGSGNKIHLVGFAIPTTSNLDIIPIDIDLTDENVVNFRDIVKIM